MKSYLRTVSDADLDTVNKALGKAIKDYFELKNTDRELEPKSKLISSYTQHIKPQ